jgi:hypothetical protein
MGISLIIRHLYDECGVSSTPIVTLPYIRPTPLQQHNVVESHRSNWHVDWCSFCGSNISCLLRCETLNCINQDLFIRKSAIGYLQQPSWVPSTSSPRHTDQQNKPTPPTTHPPSQSTTPPPPASQAATPAQSSTTPPSHYPSPTPTAPISTMPTTMPTSTC